MKYIVMALLVIGSASSAFAQEARIIKVKGQQAIVTFPSGVKPQVGQTLDVGRSSGGSGGPVGKGSRDHYIGLSAELSSLTNSASSTSTTAFTLIPRYGWNMGVIEYGASGRLGYGSTSGVSTSSLGAGGFFDFNLVPNVSGTEMVFGLFGDIAVRQDSQTISSTTTSSSVTTLFGGGQVKYFGLSDSFAIRGEAGYYYENTSPSATTNSGFKVKGAIAAYF